jgi:hypothetical protein
MSLQSRAKAFLERDIPEDVNYMADSLAERLLTAYAEEGRLDADPETLELLDLCILESQDAAEEGSPARQAWFRESLELLEAIRAEAE